MEPINLLTGRDPLRVVCDDTSYAGLMGTGRSNSHSKVCPTAHLWGLYYGVVGGASQALWWATTCWQVAF